MVQNLESLMQRTQIQFRTPLTLEEIKKMFSRIAQIKPSIRGQIIWNSAYSFGKVYANPEIGQDREWTSGEAGNFQTTEAPLLSIEYRLQDARTEPDILTPRYAGLRVSKTGYDVEDITQEEWNLVDLVSQRIEDYLA